MLKKIFSKKTHTLNSLTADFHSLEQRKSELTNEIAELKKSAFKGGFDTPRLVDALQSLGLELNLMDPAMDEVRRLMSDILTKEIENDYKNLPNREKAFQANFDKQSRQAGEMLGQVVKILESLGKSPFGHMAGVIRQIHQDALLVEKTAERMLAFDRGFLVAMNQPIDLPDFQTEARAIEQIKGRAPGSEPARNKIRNTVNKILNPPATPCVRQ